MPWIESSHTETPSPVNPLGVKGVGEAGTIGCSPAVVNSVVDALSPLGVRHIDMPLTPEKIWKLIQRRPRMIPQSIHYHTPATLEKRSRCWRMASGKILAGGMSLIPLMKLRLAIAGERDRSAPHSRSERDRAKRAAWCASARWRRITRSKLRR